MGTVLFDLNRAVLTKDDKDQLDMVAGGMGSAKALLRRGGRLHR